MPDQVTFVDCRQTLPWDYFRLARHPPGIGRVLEPLAFPHSYLSATIGSTPVARRGNKASHKCHGGNNEHNDREGAWIVRADIKQKAADETARKNCRDHPCSQTYHDWRHALATACLFRELHNFLCVSDESTTIAVIGALPNDVD